MSDLIAAALFLGLICAAAVCFRVSEWHSSESEFWSDVAMWVRIDHGNYCCWCGRPFSKEDPPTLEHLTPLAHGGGNTLDNLELSPPTSAPYPGPRHAALTSFAGPNVYSDGRRGQRPQDRRSALDGEPTADAYREERRQPSHR